MKLRTIYILRRNCCYDSSVSNVFIHTYVYIIYIYLPKHKVLVNDKHIDFFNTFFVFRRYLVIIKKEKWKKKKKKNEPRFLLISLSKNGQ